MASVTVKQIRDAIAAKIAAVPGAGTVHSYERYAKERAAFRALFVSGGVLKGWVIRKTATRETSDAIGRQAIVHRWSIRFYMGMDDAAASEESFDTLIEDVRDAFRVDETLGGLVAGTVVDGEAGLQVESSEPVMFADVLAHGARLRLSTRHYEGEAP